MNPQQTVLVKFTETLFLELIIMLMTMSNSDLTTWLILVFMRSNNLKIDKLFLNIRSRKPQD